MTVGSGWIGSSAVGETAQRWMSAAGPAINVGVPFWMSTLAGKSKGVRLTIGVKQVGMLPPGVHGPQPFPIAEAGYDKAAGIGSLTGNYNGREIIALYGSNAYAAIILRLSGAMSGSIKVRIAGTAYTLTYDSGLSGFALRGSATYFTMFSQKQNQTIEVTF